MFDNLRSRIAAAVAPKSKGSGQQALVPVTGQPVMPTVLTPKTPNKQTSYPGYVPNTAPTTAVLAKTDSRVASTEITALARQGTTTPEVIRRLARYTPDFSAAVNAYLRVGIPENWTAVARNMDGTFNRDATALAMNILRQFDLMPDYASGFSQVSNLRSVAEALGKEILLEGGMSMELVLDKNRLPYKFQPVPTSQIVFREDKTAQGIFPQQLIQGAYIDLDQPTFFYTSIDQDLLTAYGISPFESAVQPVLTAAQFATDMRRILQRAVFPRYDITIDEEALRKRIPPEYLNDVEKRTQFMNDQVSSISDLINSMDPQDAIVHFDFFTVQHVKAEGNQAQEFDTVKDIIDEKVSTGVKTMPSILGHGSGSQNVASSETLLFMMNANGIIRLKLQEMFSKAMTLAVRLFGNDVTVEFRYDSIDLRPEAELEAFKAMKQSRVLEQLSLGFITDDEASLLLTGQLTPAGFTSLCGTGFFTPITGGGGEQSNPAAAGGAGGSADPTNPNSKAEPLGNKQGAGTAARKPGTPTQPKGPAK